MRRRKGRKEKNTIMDFALLVFVIATLVILFGRKKLLDVKGPIFCNNVIKNPARRSWEMSSIDAKWLEMMCAL